MCKCPGPVKLERAAHASLDACFDALVCAAKDVTTLGYLNRDQTLKSIQATQVALSLAKEAAPEPEVAPRRTFNKAGRVRKCWDSGEWALSEQQLSLSADELAALPAAEMESLPRRYWAALAETTAKPTRRSRFAPAE
ncbi:hypothetical protein OEZ85_002582 [Tetradesmus obliquus]|uniref:Uncharacterized protein n=1 Tax=Tetradesmus obliquus TaxID=3088 RepID=A0ABY8TYE2_TETOB|nr:hypothetical protein OEZ85_002582 [Tetradesmus obliquus]